MHDHYRNIYRNAGKDQERTHIVMVMPASFQCNAHGSLRVDVSFTTSTQGRLETQVACCRKRMISAIRCLHGPTKTYHFTCSLSWIGLLQRI